MSADETTSQPVEATPAIKPMLETTGKHPRKAAEVNASVTDDPVQIRQRAEYYFNDANYPEDKFLWEKMGGFENRPFLIRTLASFSRMRRFQPYSAIVAALRDSTELIVEGAEGEEVVRRKVAYTNTPRRVVDAATVYVKGFGDEHDGTQAELEDFFAPYEGVIAVRLRRERERALPFKGSVWVVFRTEELAKQFLALEPKPTYNGHALRFMSKPAYCDMKVKMIEQGEMEPNKVGAGGPLRFWQGVEGNKSRNQNGRGNNNNRGRGRGGQRGGFKGRNERNNEPPRDAAHDPRANAQPEEASTSTKRAREDDDAGPAAKKVDTKAEVSVA